MNKSVTLLKSHKYIPYGLNVKDRLKNLFTEENAIELPDDFDYDNENVVIKKLREAILNCYLRQHLQMSNGDILKLWKSYPRIRHKSFVSIQEMVAFLINNFNFSRERIVKNSFLLYGDVENVKRILHEIPTIDNEDIREIGYKRPKILMSSCDGLLKTLEYVKSFGIPESSLLKCLEVLTLGPETILERLKELNEVEELKVLKTNPRILKLVHYQNKARLRLDYLSKLKVRCASLHILSCGSEVFTRYARDGSERTHGRDVVVFLSDIMKKGQTEIRSILMRHPNWSHIPLTHIKQCYEYLLSKKFSVDDIYNNLHLLLYPIKRIEEKFQLLQEQDFFEEMELQTTLVELSNNHILTLILYLIESEFHFTGDGIWTEQQSQVENFNNILPDFPESLSNKVYKYGVKPAGTNQKVGARRIQI